eukprot:g239.t1
MTDTNTMNEDSISAPTKESIASTVKVLSYLVAHPTFYNSPTCRPIRKAIAPLLSELRSRFPEKPREYFSKREKKRMKNIRKCREISYDQKLINSRKLRKKRLEHLQQLLGDDTDNTSEQQQQILTIDDNQENNQNKKDQTIKCLPLIPDGAVGTDDLLGAQPSSNAGGLLGNNGSGNHQGAMTTSVNLSIDKTSKEEVAERKHNDQTDSKGKEQNNALKTPTTHLLHRPRSCYTCKKRFREIHHFYDQLCPQCAELNYSKRLQVRNLRGKIILLTGSRVKIGFQAGLKLLRCGAILIATTRFPGDAIKRYRKQKDSMNWIHNLHLYRLDLQNLKLVVSFCKFILEKYPRLDGIVHNACQTIARPPIYYAHLTNGEKLYDKKTLEIGAMEEEIGITSSNIVGTCPVTPNTNPKSIISKYQECRVQWRNVVGEHNGTNLYQNTTRNTIDNDIVSDKKRKKATDAHLFSSQASLSSPSCATALFPKGLLDVNDQQIDLRDKHSWVLKLGEITPVEIASVLAINTIAPFIMNNNLRSILQSTPGKKYIVNVSAMEGKFYRKKTCNHPHTNMAKAALNMMTRTCSEELSKHEIYMNSIDTGWINDENPLPTAAKTAKKNNFQTPLDEIDAAARILDPIIIESEEHGKFFKDYKLSEW